MGCVFISYRRDDSGGSTRALYDRLVARFGKRNIDIDLEKLAPGSIYRRELDARVQSCDVLLVVIGRTWLTIADDKGRRLDDPEDILRKEIATALKREVLVIPVLVDGAQMPPASQLPEDIASLADRHNIEMAERYFDAGTKTLCEEIAKVLKRRRDVLLIKFFRIFAFVFIALAIVVGVPAVLYKYVNGSNWTVERIVVTTLTATPPPSVTLTPHVSPQPSASPTPVARGIRNNNPTNIQATDAVKKFPGFVKSDDAGFAVFATPEEGIAAWYRVLKLYHDNEFTLSVLIHRWAPSSSDANLAIIVKLSGYKDDTKIDFYDLGMMIRLTKAFIVLESGSNPYSDELISSTIGDEISRNMP